MGHIARLLEAEGISSVVIASAVLRDRLETMHLPRLVLTPHLFGRPLGMPGDKERQRVVLSAALDLLECTTHSEAVVLLG